MVKKFSELEERMKPEARQRVARRVEYELKKIEDAEKESAHSQVVPETCEHEQGRIAVNA